MSNVAAGRAMYLAQHGQAPAAPTATVEPLVATEHPTTPDTPAPSVAAGVALYRAQNPHPQQ